MTEANILRPEDSARTSEAFVRAAEIQAIHAKKVLTMHDVSVVLGKSEDTIRRMIKKRTLCAPNSLGLWEAKAFFTFISNPHR